MFRSLLPANRLSTIPWGVTLPETASRKPAGFNVLFVGQLRPYKGLEVLLQAVKNLENTKLTIVGDGYRTGHYQRLIDELGIENIDFLGKVSETELAEAYAQAHVLVLPSLTKAEAFGLVLLEGMAYGCVPIATQLPGLEDVVGNVGLTFKPGDDKELADSLRFLKESPDTVHALSEAARRRAAEFSWDRTVLAYELLFSGLARNHVSLAVDWFPENRALSQTATLQMATRYGITPVPATTPRASKAQQPVQVAFERLTQTFEASRASLMVHNPGADYLVVAAHRGLNQGLIGTAVPVRDSVAGWVASTVEPLLIDQINTPPEVRPYLRAPELSSALSVPIVEEGKVLGVLSLGRHTTEKPYTLDDLHHLVASVKALKGIDGSMAHLASTTVTVEQPTKAGQSVNGQKDGWSKPTLDPQVGGFGKKLASVDTALFRMLISTLLLFLLVTTLDLNHVIGAVVAAETAILASFVRYDGWLAQGRGRSGSLLRRLLRYQAASLSGLLIFLTVLVELATLLDVNYLTANLVAVGTASLWDGAWNRLLNLVRPVSNPVASQPDTGYSNGSTTSGNTAVQQHQAYDLHPSMTLAPLGVLLAVFSVVGLYLLTEGGYLVDLWRTGLAVRIADLPSWGMYIGYPMVALISIIGVRLLFYFDNYFFHWKRYRQLDEVTTEDIRALPEIPFIKVQVTTRGTAGTTEVIKRGIRNIVALVAEAPDVYGPKISVEVITEASSQRHELEQEFGLARVRGDIIVLPPDYKTPNGTKLKARSLHYMVEMRRKGFRRMPGRTFIVHYDEESVMEPRELRKLIHYLATTGKRLSEGPIYYPLEYGDASWVCRAMEANRPIGCFECQEVMESGVPLHLHGSNLVIDEELENELGWDIGNLDGQPFIAEDYVFGVLAYLKEGPEIFGWHGSVMLEQPPFSFKSAFRQRYRWVLGVMQGIEMMERKPEFQNLPRKDRMHLVWGVRFRILTFALGLPTGIISLLYLLYQAALVLSGRSFLPLPLPIMVWLVLIGFLWLNSVMIGAWYNISSARQFSPAQRWTEVARAISVAPIAGILESTAAFWAAANWVTGNRTVSWQPTPKTKEADKAINWRAAS